MIIIAWKDNSNSSTLVTSNSMSMAGVNGLAILSPMNIPGKKLTGNVTHAMKPCSSSSAKEEGLSHSKSIA